MTDYQCKQIVLFKSISETENHKHDMYYETFLSKGFNTILIPVLDFEFINLEELFIKLKNYKNYSGIIFTSPRSVLGLELSINNYNNKDIINQWKYQTNYVIGERTEKLAKDIGFITQGKETGNSDALAELICKKSFEKPFLYLTGSLTEKNFKIKLEENNIKVDDLIIYKTKPHPNLEENILKLKSEINNKLAYFIYFSPSCVNFTIPILKKLNYNFDYIKFVAIGPTTEKYLIKSGYKISKTSHKPNPEYLLEAILEI